MNHYSNVYVLSGCKPPQCPNDLVLSRIAVSETGCTQHKLKVVHYHMLDVVSTHSVGHGLGREGGMVQIEYFQPSQNIYLRTPVERPFQKLLNACFSFEIGPSSHKLWALKGTSQNRSFL